MKKEGKTKTESEEEFNLKDVIALGGDKEDYEMLKDVESGAKSTQNTDTFNQSEFESLIKELGFSKYHEETKVNCDEPKKSLKSVQEKEVSGTVDSLPPLPIDLDQMPSKLLIKSNSLWHEIFTNDPPDQGLLTKPYADILQTYGNKLYENEVMLHKNKSESRIVSSSGNAKWMNTVAKAGTLSDRVAALSLMVQEAPVHNLSSFEQLCSMSKKKGKREAFMALEAIRDLLLGDLLPNGRKLKTFNQQAINTLTLSLQAKDCSGEWSLDGCRSRLITWIFENKLKELCVLIVELITTMSHDAMEVSKTKAMSVALDLLLKKPEQEKALLSLLVNKLGDPKYKIASKALHMLNCVVEQHPLMQQIVINSVRDLLLRPNIAARAQYYCICFLSAQMLSHDRKEVAVKLVQIYMSFFKASLKKKDSSGKMLSALLTGVNRAFPYADSSDKGIIEELDVLFKTVHVAGLSTTVQALVLLYQVYTSRNEVSDRFHNAFYSSLFHPELTTCTPRHPMFLNLLYRSMKADVCEPRVQAYIKRLIQSCSLQLPPYSVACLTLVFELCKARPSIIYGFLGSKSLDGSKNMDEDDGEEHFTDVKDEFDVESGYTKEPSNTNATSWTHKHKDSMRHTSNVYNPLHRNPLYAAADQTNLWEVHSMTRHFHPTVAIYAKELYESKTDSDTRTGDPLDDYTLIKFLDRFVYRNPKSKEVTSRKKANQSVRLLSANHRRRHAAFNQTQIPVNSPEFLQKTNLAPDEVFYHRYFSQLSHMKTPKADKTEEDSDIESVSDGEFDEFMSGQAKNNKLDFSESIYNKSSAPNEKFNEEDSDRESGSEDQASETEDYGFNMEEGEDDLLEEEDLDEAGIFDSGPKETGKRKVNKGSSRESKPPTKRRRHENDLDKFNIMMEENANDKSNSGTSSTLVNKDRSSHKQLKWEAKRALEKTRKPNFSKKFSKRKFKPRRK